jgi:hypothetical protein
MSTMRPCVTYEAHTGQEEQRRCRSHAAAEQAGIKQPASELNAGPAPLIQADTVRPMRRLHLSLEELTEAGSFTAADVR